MFHTEYTAKNVTVLALCPWLEVVPTMHKRANLQIICDSSLENFVCVDGVRRHVWLLRTQKYI